MSRNRPDARGCLLITNIFPPAVGGSSQVYAALAAGAQGDIVVLSSSHDHQTGVERQDWKAADRRAGYPVHRLTCVRPFLRTAYPGPAFLYRFHELAVAMRLAAAVVFFSLRYRARAICIADDETVGWLALVSKYLLARRTLIYCHGDDLQGQAVAGRSRWFGLADTVVAASRYAADRLEKVFGVVPDKILVIPNGVDLGVFGPRSPDAALMARYGLAGRRVLLTVTRLVPRKGVDKVLEALPAVIQKFPDLVYLIVGDGPQQQALQQRTLELGMGDRVIFAGAIDHGKTVDFYNAADIVVLPNRAEGGESDGLPLVFLEANACAKPVIGGTAGGTPEIVRHGENGLLVDGGNVAEIAAALSTLLGDKTGARAMGLKGQQMAQDWGWPARTHRFLQACRS